MKKLIMFAVVAILACAGQAASVDWSMAITGQGATWSGNSAYVMAFKGTDYDAVIKLLTVDGSDNMATDLGAYALALGSGGTMANVSNARGTAKASGTSDGVTADGTMFWVVFTDGSMDAGSAIQYTAATSIAAYDYEAGSPAPGTFALNSFANSGTIAGVPEPTSGLLMLVGLAGLALRRRRA